MVDPKDIHPLSDFQRNAKTHLNRLKKSGLPAILTVNGRARVVIQDAAAYQRMQKRIELLESVEAIREGLNQARSGRTRPWEEARAELIERFKTRKPSRRRAG